MPLIRLDDFMKDALEAYYHNRDPLGVDGDFTTAPEISQLFGEIVGLWCAQQWIKMGHPDAFHLIEIGPGRGTLMADLLRATQHIPNFQDSATIHLIETSPILKQKQQTTLSHYSNIQWHSDISDIPNDAPVIIIGNEFLDALPIRQFKKIDGDKWTEHYIDTDTSKSEWLDTDTPLLKATLPTATQHNDIAEYSSAQNNFLTNLTTNYHGCALFIDYGYEKSHYGDSLQALYKHKPCEITDHIGDADLTSHIDFEWVGTFFENSRITTQGQFLSENGIAIRYHQLNNSSLLSGYERLIHPSQMGELFKVIEGSF